MAPPAAPAGHRPIQSFFRGGHEPCSTSTALPEATAPAPAAPPAAASVPAGCVPAWDRPNDRPRVVAYARRRRGARAGDAASLGGATFSSDCDAKRPRLSVDRNRAEEEDADADASGEGLPGPSPSASSEMFHEPKRWTNRSGSSVPVPVPTKVPTKQLFLDLGQKSFGHVTCATCGLLYAKGEREDERTHAAYHAAHVEAEGSAPSDAVSKVRDRKFGIACPRRWGFESAAWRSPDGSEWVVVCGRRDHAKRRAVALKIAAHVERMLGMRAGWALENEKAKMFVRVAGDRAVGALIAEPVSGAFRTVPETRGDAIQHERENANKRENANAQKKHRHGDEDDERDAVFHRSITRRGDARERATLGVRALWTHPARRRCGVASQLLDTARHGMTAGYVSGERECAFTQPTEAGKRFARKACGREDGTFLVYLPDD